MSKMYRDPSLNGGRGGDRPVKGNSVGPFVVPKNESGVAQSAGTVADPMHTQHVDSNGRVEGEVGYVEPTVQALLIDENGDPIDPATEIQITQQPSTEHIFHEAATTPANGTDFTCNGQYNKLRVQIVRADVATNNINFLQSVDGTHFDTLLGNYIDSNGNPQIAIAGTITTSKIVEFDIAGATVIRMDLTALTGTGATVTVSGVAV